MPCVASPCSPSDSPWSAVTTMSVLRGCLSRSVQQRTERGVGPRHLAEVRCAGISSRPLRRRGVGGVRIVEVHPREPLALLPADPLRRRRDDRIGAAFAFAGIDRRRRVQPIVIGVEADAQAETAIERKPADERAGREPRGLQQCRDRRPARLEAIPGVVADAVLVRIPSAEDARVRRQRDDGVRVREVKRAPRAASASRFGVAAPPP